MAHHQLCRIWSSSGSTTLPSVRFLVSPCSCLASRCIADCSLLSPGEELPPFPPPTHSRDSELQRTHNLAPLVTVNDAISYIPPGTSHHDVDSAEPVNCQPYDASAPLPYCITTSGGGNYHPDGRRKFTTREFACLQSFPLSHEFHKVAVKKQIGNAVPPVVAKTMFEAVRKALEKADEIDLFSN